MKKNTILTCITLFIIIAGLTTGLVLFKMTTAPADRQKTTVYSTSDIPATENTETTAAEPVEATTEAPVEGEIFLTVSEINFSTVGETEDIYAGTVPADRISWVSDDESVIQVSDGVLTAVGVGSTTITASCGDQQITCKAGCLAENKEDLKNLSMDLLRSPKRIAPSADDAALSFYDHSVLIGDILTYSFSNYEKKDGRMDDLQCLYKGSLSVQNLLKHRQKLSYKGSDMDLEEILAVGECEKALILLGTNDLMQRTPEEVIGELDQLLTEAVRKTPDVSIYLLSVFPVANRNIQANGVNERIINYNDQLKTYAEQHGYHYLPVSQYMEDHIPGFAQAYAQDKYQPNAKGVSTWIDALRTYAYIETLNAVTK